MPSKIKNVRYFPAQKIHSDIKVKIELEDKSVLTIFVSTGKSDTQVYQADEILNMINDTHCTATHYSNRTAMFQSPDINGVIVMKALIKVPDGQKAELNCSSIKGHKYFAKAVVAQAA
jgi:hypothetical protein